MNGGGDGGGGKGCYRRAVDGGSDAVYENRRRSKLVDKISTGQNIYINETNAWAVRYSTQSNN